MPIPMPKADALYVRRGEHRVDGITTPVPHIAIELLIGPQHGAIYPMTPGEAFQVARNLQMLAKRAEDEAFGALGKGYEKQVEELDPVHVRDYYDGIADIAISADLEVSQLKSLLNAHGICVDCGQVMKHHVDEPFASCACGTAEWADGFTPYMKLQMSVRDESDNYGARQ